MTLRLFSIRRAGSLGRGAGRGVLFGRLFDFFDFIVGFDGFLRSFADAIEVFVTLFLSIVAHWAVAGFEQLFLFNIEVLLNCIELFI